MRGPLPRAYAFSVVSCNTRPVARTLRLRGRLLPRGADLAPLIDTARPQLHRLRAAQAPRELSYRSDMRPKRGALTQVKK